MQWMSPEQAATWLGVTRAAVRVIAHREGWRRIRLGREVGYHPDDVDDTRERRLGQTGLTRV